METPIYDFVKRYGEQDISRLHMPGHKGAAVLGCEKWDITEIKGADALYEADGIIAESEENARRLFGMGRTLYSTEGSSQCIRAMLFLAMQQAEKTAVRPVVLAARNAHKAFLYSCALLDLDVQWMMPMQEKGASLCSCPITPLQVRDTLKEMKQKPIAVYITAPDYLGYSPDIRGIADVCREAGLPLLVDNAHGAYLGFLEPSRHPVHLGAAMSCDSAHKTLPVLTSGAYLQLSAEWAEKAGGQAKKALELFGSTSPSYLILQSLDRFNADAAYRADLKVTIAQMDVMLKEKLLALGWEVAHTDPLKLTVYTGSMGYTGAEVAEHLRNYDVECEFADLNAVVLMATPSNTAKDFQRVKQAFYMLQKKEAIAKTPLPLYQPKQCMTIREAIFSQWESVPVREAVGRICGVPCVSCPPAIPIAASGEEITEELIELFLAYGIETIDVVRE